MRGAQSGSQGQGGGGGCGKGGRGSGKSGSGSQGKGRGGGCSKGSRGSGKSGSGSQGKGRGGGCGKGRRGSGEEGICSRPGCSGGNGRHDFFVLRRHRAGCFPRFHQRIFEELINNRKAVSGVRPKRLFLFHMETDAACLCGVRLILFGFIRPCVRCAWAAFP